MRESWELQKLLKIFLDKDRKHFSVGEELSLSVFLYGKMNGPYEAKQNSDS